MRKLLEMADCPLLPFKSTGFPAREQFRGKRAARNYKRAEQREYKRFRESLEEVCFPKKWLVLIIGWVMGWWRGQ